MVQLGIELFEWEDLPEHLKKCTYWMVVPKDLDCFDGSDYEIAYVNHNDDWHVVQVGEAKKRPLTDFWFAYQIGLPQT